MLEAVVAGLFGLLIGSFLNVCIYRLPRDLSVVRPRSFCPSCEQTIAWYDNIPVLTYLALGGKCRRCGARIPWRYPVVELLTGALFFAAVLELGPNAAGYKLCVFAAIQVALIFTDIEERILPDEFTLGGLVIGLGFSAIVFLPGFVMSLLFPDASPRRISVYESVLAALVVSGMLYLLAVAYGRLRRMEVLGLGDVKMMAMIGAFLGLQRTLFTLVAASIAGSVVGLAYILLARKDWRQYPLPFGAFIGAAALYTAYT